MGRGQVLRPGLGKGSRDYMHPSSITCWRPGVSEMRLLGIAFQLLKGELIRLLTGPAVGN